MKIVSPLVKIDGFALNSLNAEVRYDFNKKIKI